MEILTHITHKGAALQSAAFQPLRQAGRVLLLSAVLLLFGGCEKSIEFDGDSLDAEVVLVSQPQAGCPWMAHLSYSQFFLYDDSVQYINDAVVSATVNGRDAGVVRLLSDGVYAVPVVPQPGDTLTLCVQAPGREAATAGCRIPRFPQVSRVEYLFDTVQEVGWEAGTRGYGTVDCRFTLHDPAGEANYYMLCASEYDEKDKVRKLFYLYVDDDLLFPENGTDDFLDLTGDEASYGTRVLFTDEKIDGQSHSISLQVSYTYHDSGPSTAFLAPTPSSRFRIDLVAISRDLYLYLATTKKSYSQDESVLSSIVTEPVQIICNVEGGIGILGGQATTTVLESN